MSKRGFDVVTAGAGVLLLSPLMLGLAVWVKLDSPGPVFFRQHRVGRRGEVFRVFQFRTMVETPHAHDLPTIGQESRVTRAGRFLRRYRLDALPQLLNVIQGTMSLIGPRPQTTDYVASCPPDTRVLLLSHAPGMIDWTATLDKHTATRMARAALPQQQNAEAALPARLDYYVRYERGRSWWIDLRIVLRALLAVLGRRC
jgi:lipopolysaccharide/colanic/teichoic acid biosynthesis glycosyltransferase